MDAEAFIKGCETALKECIDEMQTPLMKYCYNILLNYADAEDAVQTTFIKAYKNRNNIRNSITLPAYLYRVAYSTSIDIIRKRRFFMVDSQRSNNCSNFISEEMQAALSKLTALDRAIVYGRAVDELSYSELSEIYGKSEQILRKRYERAKKKLINILKKNDREESIIIHNKRKENLI